MKTAIFSVLVISVFPQFSSNGATVTQGYSTTTNNQGQTQVAGSTSCDLKKIQIQLNDIQNKVDAIWKYFSPQKAEKNCADYYKKGIKTNGIYSVDPDGNGSFKVFCDMTGGGWTVFQRRLDGSVDFYRGWQDYKAGFGDLKGEFWLGLEKIYRLTLLERNRLRIDLGDSSGNTKYAEYSYFAITNERTKYQLSVGTYTGTAGDSLTYHRGSAFSTIDSDNDNWSKHCAVTYKGAWWYESCLYSNLNGMYYLGKHSGSYDGVTWYHWTGAKYSLKDSVMKIRPENFGM